MLIQAVIFYLAECKKQAENITMFNRSNLYSNARVMIQLTYTFQAL